MLTQHSCVLHKNDKFPFQHYSHLTFWFFRGEWGMWCRGEGWEEQKWVCHRFNDDDTFSAMWKPKLVKPQSDTGHTRREPTSQWHMSERGWQYHKKKQKTLSLCCITGQHCKDWQYNTVQFDDIEANINSSVLSFKWVLFSQTPNLNRNYNFRGY